MVYVIVKVVYYPTMEFLGFSGCSHSLEIVDVVENRLKYSFISIMILYQSKT